MTKEQKQKRLKETARRLDNAITNARDQFAGEPAVDWVTDELSSIMNRITAVTTLVDTRKADWEKVALDHIFNLYD